MLHYIFLYIERRKENQQTSKRNCVSQFIQTQ